MDDHFRHIAAVAATQHSVISTAQLLAEGIDPSLCSKWQRRGLIDRLGPRSFAIGGSAPTFARALAAGLADLAGFGVVAGTHASRRQRQIDAQRRTELTLRGLRVLTFTYEDVRDRPSWVIARLREAIALAA